MSRLDQHIASVRNKLALTQFVHALAWTLLILATLVLLYIVVSRLLRVELPHQPYLLFGGAGAAALAAVVLGVVRRPSHAAAAVAIDQRLGLKEKFSTALQLRNGNNDAFALAAIRDAEQTAQRVAVNFKQHFPFKFPGATYALIGVTAAALAAFYLIPTDLDLFGKEAARAQLLKQEAAMKAAEAQVKKALATVEAVPKASQDLDAVKQAKLDLASLLRAPIKDPASANRSALKALQDVNDAVKNQIENQQKFAAAQNDAKLLKNMAPDPQDKGPLADAQRAMAAGEFAKAADDLKKLVENFDKLDNDQQQQASQQMQKLAQQLQQAAQNPQQMQQMQQQLQQQLGLNQQQAQQMAQQMQQAAQGNPQAQQQLQQMAQQMMQQLNNGQGPNQQQQQQIQQMMQQMQAQMGNQQAQQQMAQAMQQMAQAMQQAAQAQQGQQPGQQPQPGEAGQQQMQQAMQQMQQQLDQMEAVAQDAQQLADAQAGLDQAMQEAAGMCNGEGEGEGGQAGNGGQWREGDPNRMGNNGDGMGGAGIAAGDRSAKQQAPFGVKRETAPSQNTKDGRLLASIYIKDNKPIKGSGKAELRDVAAAAEQEAADEVDTDRVGRGAQNVVKDYFGSLSKEEEPAAPTEPAPLPK
ncbi:MAG TPA: hypothetical protein PLD59_05595 [Tepidisphaeraceae bacterium]|nr:hypothetical protein [Tepidisphaeraceae bacterium]